MTYAHNIDKAEARIDWRGDAVQILRKINAFNPAPGAFFELDGERFKVLAADLTEGMAAPGEVLDDVLSIACGTGAIRPTLVQRAGKPAMATADMLRGLPIAAGTHLP